jgi:hypothetical protein
MNGEDDSDRQGCKFESLLDLSKQNSCTICNDYEVENAGDRVRHVIRAHNVPPFLFPHYTCLGCGEVFDFPTIAANHTATQHQGKYSLVHPEVLDRFSHLIVEYLGNLQQAVGMPFCQLTRFCLLLLTKVAKAVCTAGQNGTSKLAPFTLARDIDTHIYHVAATLADNTMFTDTEGLKPLVSGKNVHIKANVAFGQSLIRTYNKMTGKNLLPHHAAALTNWKLLLFAMAGVDRTRASNDVLNKWRSGRWHDGAVSLPVSVAQTLPVPPLNSVDMSARVQTALTNLDKSLKEAARNIEPSISTDVEMKDH